MDVWNVVLKLNYFAIAEIVEEFHRERRRNHYHRAVRQRAAELERVGRARRAPVDAHRHAFPRRDPVFLGFEHRGRTDGQTRAAADRAGRYRAARAHFGEAAVTWADELRKNIERGLPLLKKLARTNPDAQRLLFKAMRILRRSSNRR